MATLGTQNISTSYPQLLKVSGNTPFTGTLVAIASGDESSVSALEISTLGVRSSGTLNSAGATTLASSLAVTGAATFSSSLGVTGAATLSSSLAVTGVATFSTSINASSGTATIGTLSVGTATISTATIPLQLGAITFGSSITASTGTATIGTLSAGTATISTATIPNILGVSTFATGFTSSTGTNTIGTIASTTISNTGLATVGSLEIGGTAGPTITKVSYGTAAFTGSTFQDLDSVTAGSNVTTGTFAVTGAALGDIVFGGLTSIGSSTGTNATLAQRLIPSFRVESADTIRYVILNTDIVSHGTTPAGTLYATAMRFTA